MASHNRATLRSFFADGQRPTGKQFSDLIDSMLNMVDEGFRKSPERGLEVSAAVQHDALMSFSRDQRPQEPLWSMGFAAQQDRLQFERTGADTPVLTLDTAQDAKGQTQARVGVNVAQPEHALHVGGVVSAQGRVGSLPLPGDQPPMADGEWYDITPPLQGCQAFEVMACAGLEDSGQFALMHATAMNAFNPTSGLFDRLLGRKRIRAQHAWYGKRCDRLELRWNGTSGAHAKYTLQVRSRCIYGDGKVPIRVQMTQLWFHSFAKGAP